jgi:hypothetical protein
MWAALLGCIINRSLTYWKIGFVYKMGLVLECWIPHISVGTEIYKLSLVFRVGNILELLLFSVEVDKTIIL